MRYIKELAYQLWCSPCNERRRFKSYPHCKVKGKIIAFKKTKKQPMLCGDYLVRKEWRCKTTLTRCSQSLCKLFHGNIIDFLHSLKYHFCICFVIFKLWWSSISASKCLRVSYSSMTTSWLYVFVIVELDIYIGIVSWGVWTAIYRIEGELDESVKSLILVNIPIK